MSIEEKRDMMKGILAETVDHFTSDNRAVLSENSCVYATDNSLSPGEPVRNCAVGRYMLDPHTVQLNINGDSDLASLHVAAPDGLDSLLRPEVRGLAIAFWADLQLLHDCPGYWNEDGLTSAGHKLGSKPIAKLIDNGAYDIL